MQNLNSWSPSDHDNTNKMQLTVLGGIIAKLAARTPVNTHSRNLGRNVMRTRGNWLTNGHAGGDGMRVDDEVRHNAILRPRHVLLVVGYANGALLPMSAGKLVADLRYPDGAHLPCNPSSSALCSQLAHLEKPASSVLATQLAPLKTSQQRD